MEKDFQRELLLGMDLYDGVCYKIPDLLGAPFRGKKFKTGGQKPFDIFWIRPGTFYAIELKQVRNRQSWNICKETDSSSLKEHQLECLQVTAECGHEALVLVNFHCKITAPFKKKYPDLCKGRKDLIDLAFAVPIQDIILERDAGVEQLSLSWFIGKYYDIVTRQVNGKKIWDPERMITNVEVDKWNRSLAARGHLSKAQTEAEGEEEN